MQIHKTRGKKVVLSEKEEPVLPPATEESTPPTPPDNDNNCTPRASHPNSHNKFLFLCNDRLAAFNAFDLIETISPRPILLIVGSEADTIYFSQTAYEKANEPKELYCIDGATHIDLYDKVPFVEQVAKKLSEFFY